MKFSLFIIRFTTIVLTAALVVISASAQEISLEKSTSTRPEDVYSFEADIAKYPLKPPDTSSPRATLQSFLDNMNRAYRVLMAAHRNNIDTPGLFTSKSAQQMARHAEESSSSAASMCLNLSEVPKPSGDNVGYEGVLKLKEIFDRIDLPPFASDSRSQADRRGGRTGKNP